MKINKTEIAVIIIGLALTVLLLMSSNFNQYFSGYSDYGDYIEY